MESINQFKILIVDDRYENLLALAAVLKKAKFQTDTALSGNEALKLLLKNKYALIILDVQMPDMNGFELAELIKGNSKTKDIPLIFLSANAVDKEFSLKGIEVGALDYLSKPVDENLLLLKVKNLVELHHVAIKLDEANKALEKKAILAQISYQDLYFSLPQEVFLINKEGLIISINRFNTLFCGLNANELIHQHFSKSQFLNEILGQNNGNAILRYFTEDSELNTNLEFEIERPNKTIFYGRAIITSAIIEGKFHIQVSIYDENEIKKQELFLKQINDSVAVKTGASYFSELTKFCCEKLGVKYAMVGNYILDENSVESISFRNGDTEFPDYKYDLTHTPCSLVLNGTMCVYPNNVQAQFPKDEDLKTFGIESYLGMPLLDENNNPIGIIVLLDDKPMEDVLQKEKLLSFLGPRAANELISIKTNQKLKESELFNKGVLSSLSSQIAVIDSNGNIISVNNAWTNFALENGVTNLERTVINCNYFEVCEKAIKLGDAYAEKAMQGIKSVLTKEISQFEMEYPCDGPEEERWFILSVTGFEGDYHKAVIRHVNITERKQRENLQKTLYSIVNFSTKKTTVVSICEYVYGKLTKLFNVEGFYVALIDSENNELIFPYSVDYKNNLIEVRTNFKRPLAKGFSEYVINTKKTLLLNSTDLPKFLQENPELKPVGQSALSWMGAPLFLNGEVIGVVGVQSYIKANPFSSKNIEFINFIAENLATVIDRVQSHEKLIKNEERFRTLFERNLAGVYRANMNNIIIECNDAFAQIIGLKNANDVIGKHARELYDNLTHPNFEELLFNNAGKLTLEEGIIQRKNGENVYLLENASLIMNESGEPKYMEGTIIDISERKKQEKELLLSKEKFESVVNNINDGLFQDDLHGNVTYYNQKFLDIFGLSASGMSNISIENFTAKEYHPEMFERHFRRIAGEKVDEIIHYEGIHKNGHRIWIESKVTLLKENNVVIGTQSILRDITQRKRQEEQLHKTAKELSNRNNELMQFNYIVSHNLRSPIANLIGLSNLINSPEVKEDDKPKILDFIQQAALKMDDQVKDLNVVLASRSAINEKKEIVSFPILIESISNTLSLQINESAIIIKTEIHPDAIEIFSIKSYLESILYNLISNAIKYKSINNTPSLNIEIKKIGDAFEIKISDNGVGIDLKLHGEYVFGLYKRFNLEIEGKGLGLHMTKNQVETLGGTIAIESVPDKGTVFLITLPV